MQAESEQADVEPPDVEQSGPEPLDLASRQRALIRSLVAGGPVPVGVDGHRVRTTAAALRRKRARAVAQHWPALRTVPDFDERFAAWAEPRTPAPAHDEGVAFADSLGPDRPVAVGVELVADGGRRVARVRGGLVLRWGRVRVLTWPNGRR